MTQNHDPKKLILKRRKGISEATQLAEMTLCPAVNAALVADVYQGSVFGNNVDVNELMNNLQASMDKSNSGDLSELENMLIGQATALQAMFVNLARRAQAQQYQKNLEAFLGLALKAQAQSRATIQAVVDLKFPRHLTFVKQANIANGPQQVNNTATSSRALEEPSEQNELIVGEIHGRKKVDARATSETAREGATVEAMATVYRS